MIKGIFTFILYCRHFALVVSERIIVQVSQIVITYMYTDVNIHMVTLQIFVLQASNLGNFDNDVDYSWARGSSTDSICHFVSG